ncbi:hypothetical protein DdX_17584 [Ditylenchus destructor]|uniref:Uncharacterized protein n=1 Tax=Ditylenchus destructor TaxID=166010 RepID=A0AAD4QTC1_9BILA|nr:hypothetical protein DdX_17584 [Ditylenchus destructor]
MTKIACFAIVFLLISHVVAKHLEAEDQKTLGSERLAAWRKSFGMTNGNGNSIQERRGWLSTYCATPYCATVHIVPLPIVPPDNCATGLLCHRTVVPPLKYRGN